ncbi:MAG: glycosyltransferase family 4 protein [Planctomycetota bacterium]
MHVGYVLKKFPRNSETFILNEILALQRHGADVTVFSLNRPDDGVYHRGLSELKRPVVYMLGRKPEGVPAHLKSCWDLLDSRRDRVWGQFQDLILAQRPDTWSIVNQGLDLALLCKKHGIDRMHAHFATIAAYVARACNALTDIPFSVTCHAKDIYREGVTGDRFRALLKPSDFVVTVCEANKRYILDQHQTEGTLDLRVLYNGVDVQAFHPGAREPSAEPTILSVGRLVEKKGFHILFDALAQMKQQGFAPRCEIIGDGEDRDALHEQVRRLGLDNVVFLGMQTQDQVRAHMATATVMALPCIVGADGNRDALPTVLLEALASGLPILSTPVGGVEEIADFGKAGVIVEPGDVTALARELTALLRDKARLAAFSKAGRARAEQCFDLSTNVGKLLSWFEGGRKAPGASA